MPIQEFPVAYQPRSIVEGKKIGAVDFFRLLAALLHWRFALLDAIADATRRACAPSFYIVTRLIIGALLMFAGLEKITAGQPMLMASAWAIPSGVVIGWGVLECLLGWLTLSFVARRPLRILLTVLFGAFASLLVVEW